MAATQPPPNMKICIHFHGKKLKVDYYDLVSLVDYYDLVKALLTTMIL
ncbi:hypothetical protein MTBBW1_600033 [Desulfamplus magnetovallimortis]|uniref:Uncharacterized protein n=1 Tax=Desulfamplus magnetovallimortis TaxID=1246637 RepID=A0A1W1HIE5_9BACT|nr:hypothetical protein [Desulfamplus magnetovallimortis]SLM32203.1 hypothetical protein MTBBW1_600033 [Desulfamplus magnetovallimortis]